MFRRDLYAAEFFVLAAIAQAERMNMHYPEAEADLELIRRFMSAIASQVRVLPGRGATPGRTPAPTGRPHGQIP